MIKGPLSGDAPTQLSEAVEISFGDSSCESFSLNGGRPASKHHVRVLKRGHQPSQFRQQVCKPHRPSAVHRRGGDSFFPAATAPLFLPSRTNTAPSYWSRHLFVPSGREQRKRVLWQKEPLKPQARKAVRAGWCPHEVSGLNSRHQQKARAETLQNLNPT